MPREISHEFSEEEASRIWRRAAELQARRRLPTRSDEDTSGDAEQETDREGRLSSEEVVAIAHEAGIAPEFVRQALTEAIFVPPAEEEIGFPALRSERTVDAPLETVQAVLQEIAAAKPYRLRLTDIRTAGEGRTLVFDINGGWGEQWETNALRAGDLGAGRIATAVHAILLPSPESPDRTDLRLYCPPNPDLPRSIYRHDVGFGGIGGLAGGAGIGALAAEVLALSGAAVLAPAVVGALAFGGAGVYLVRVLHRWSRNKDAASLEKLADEIAGAVRIRKLSNSLPPASDLRLDT